MTIMQKVALCIVNNLKPAYIAGARFSYATPKQNLTQGLSDSKAMLDDNMGPASLCHTYIFPFTCFSLPRLVTTVSCTSMPREGLG